MKKLILPILLGLLPFLLFGQREIKGTVIGEYSNPLYGINVHIKGTNIHTSTNNNGEFILNVKNDRSFVISFSSMTTVPAEREIPSGTKDFSMKIQLQDKILGLPAIDIIGAKKLSV